MEEGEHEEGDEHSEDEHMEEDEHEEGDEHGEDEHMEGEHDDDHEHAEVPHEYEDLENPFAGNSTAVAAGTELFTVNCASCHGDTGLGDGAAAVGLDPKPASLADSSMMSDLTDAYIFWRITEGGTMEPFNSAMPPWKDILSEEQRWQLVSFVRSLSQ
jgi:mono/diheme cytochrome c family protein